MPTMTDVTEPCPAADEQYLSQPVNKLELEPDGSAAWVPPTYAVPIGPELNLGTGPCMNMGLEDMPALESLGRAPTVPYSSPVPSSFMEADHTMQLTYHKDLKDPCAEQGVSGLQNLGNTCFMNAGIQCLISNPRISRYFLEDFECDDCMLGTLTGKFSTQVKKVWTGQYSIVTPTDFKEVLGMYYPQFKDFRQHDCQEFLALLLDSLHEQLNQGVKFGTKCETEEEDEEDSQDPGQSTSSCMGPEHDSRPNPSEQNLLSPANNQEISELEMTPATSSDIDQMSQSQLPTDCLEQQSVVSSSISQSELVCEDSNQSQPLSEDSCQSETSQESADPVISENKIRRMEPIPEHFRTDTAEEDMDISDSRSNALAENVDSTLRITENETGKPNDLSDVSEDRLIANTRGKRLPSLEDLYMKDTKTLNVNVLATEFINEMVTTDSEKFHKPDNTNRPVDPYEHLNDFLTYGTKDSPAKPIKETNLLANLKDKFSDDCFTKKSLFSDMLAAEEKDCSINNIKRMKIDEDEKNIRMQARLKVNMDKNPTREENLKIHSPREQRYVSRDVEHSLSPQAGPGVGIDLWVEDEQMRIKNFLEAERAWTKYLKRNQSVIVDTFQGQFKSTVVCSECHQRSVTYEPFMYLSVPLPHAMERQIVVTFVPCDTRLPVRYLLSLHKQDNMRKLKLQLLDVIGEESSDIIIAEVLDNHISRILEDSVLLRNINDYNRIVYAFEMMPAPLVDDAATNSDDASTLTDDITSGSDDTLVSGSNNVSSSSLACVPANNVATQATDIFSNIATFPATAAADELHVDSCVANNAQNVHVSNTTEHKDLDAHSILNNLGENSTQVWREGFGLSTSGIEWQENILKEAENSSFERNKEISGGVISGPMDWKKMSTESDDVTDTESWPVSGTGDASTACCNGNNIEVGDSNCKVDDLAASAGDAGGVADQWKSCAICLEEMVDSDLLVHTCCRGTLCQSCVEMSFKHYGEAAFMCPVCSSHVNPAEDFIQLSAMADYKPKTRILSVPIVQRYDYEDVEEKRLKLFGHPNILYLPSNMTGEFLYESVDRVVPCLANYSILLTDGQGFHCSRCMYTEHCTGCEVLRDCDINLQPGDHLAIHFTDLTVDQMDITHRVIDHESMEDLRTKEPLTLLNCFSAFTDSEVLDKHNPWYCPRCHKNQCARKTITVWRYPETLVVYLKRFVFHELSSTKIDNKVIFPLTDLDLSEFITGPVTSDLHYNLQCCVCHFGGVNAGHYTAYAKHPAMDEWHYYNDETTLKRCPQDEDYSSAYILFYQRQGTQVNFTMPNKELLIADCEKANASLCGITGMEVVSDHRSPLNNDAIRQLLQELQEDTQREEAAKKEGETSSEFNFYS